MKLSFAPMEGVTGVSYRRIHSQMFPGADRYYAPFIAPDSQGNFRLKHLRDVLPDNNRGIALVPQILANSPEAFLSVAAQLKELGYDEVNLNAGCPSGTVVAKHKGAGMLSDLSSLDAFLSRVFEAAPVIEKDTKGKSFPSRHVFSAFIIAFTAGCYNPAAGGALAVCGTLLAVTRVLGGVHFIRDVAAGAAAGIGLGLAGFILL